jgi:DDE superfamily endonuclease
VEYEDETWFVWVPPQGIMNPEAGQGWAPAGKPPRNRATRKKGQETFNAYLSLDLKEQRLAWRYTEHTNQTETRAFLEERLAAHARQGHRLLLVPWDPATWHRARELRGWIRAHNRAVERDGVGVKLVPVELPKGAFWLNRVDAIIRQTKGRVLPCRQFASQEEQRTVLDRHWLHRNLREAHVPRLEQFFVHLH